VTSEAVTFVGSSFKRVGSATNRLVYGWIIYIPSRYFIPTCWPAAARGLNADSRL